MTSEELDLALEELEVRLERLRALYEQYFLGFEKIEPQVARKDVDRRIYVMRREKIRNTGKRFKLQTIIQRYNTFQQYWQRICREIENGTYKRHVLRAERQLSNDQQLTIATRRRFGRTSVAPPAETAAAVESSPPVEAAAAAPSAPPPTAESRPPAVAAKTSESIRPQAIKSITKPPPAPVPSPRPAKYESLDLDMGFLGSWKPPGGLEPSAPVAKPAQAPAPAPVAPPPRPARPAAPPPKPARPAAPVPKPAPAPAAPAAHAQAGGVTDDRVRELHEKLNQMKRDNREGQVSLESLTKTIRASETQLQAQYKGRKIDFEIVQKDGKTIVKPKVR